MTDAHLDALDDAIRAYITTNEDADDGAIVTGWALFATTYLPDHDGEAHGYWRVTPERQAIHTTLGLLEEARQAYLANATASLLDGAD